MATVTVDGGSLEFVERGEGEAVVFVHGSASDLRTWSRQVEEFGRTHRAIAFSRRYHWPNARIPDGRAYALEDHVRDLDAVLDALDAAPAHLVGHSYGGVVCLEQAVARPQTVRSLCLIEPPVMNLFVHLPPRPRELLALVLRDPAKAAGIVRLGALGFAPAAKALERGDHDEAMRRLGEAILGRKAYRALGDERRAQVRDNLILEELTSPEFLPRRVPADFRGVNAEVLLVSASSSPGIFSRLAGALDEILPRCRRVVLEGASHIAHEDAPGEFRDVLLDFLEGVVR